MFESRYGKFLTILLIIVIVAIVGLLGFLVVNLIINASDDNEGTEDAERFISQVTNKVNQNKENTAEVNEVDNSVAIPNIEDNTQPPAPSGGSGSSSGGSTYEFEGFTAIGAIEIPRTGLTKTILNEVTGQSIKKAVAVLYPSNLQLLNEPGNVTIVGHNYRNGTFFSNNKNIQEGDKIYITDIKGRRVEYTVYRKYFTTAEDSDFMMRDTNGRREISLSTCTEDVKQRLVIWASADPGY